MKIAFASIDNIHINQHFGWCEKFFIYEIDENSSTFIKDIDSSLKLDNEVDKLEYKINSLDNADIVYVAQIGPKASTMVQSAGIMPLKSSNENQTIEEAIKKLQEMMKENTPLWLKRILFKKG